LDLQSQICKSNHGRNSTSDFGKNKVLSGHTESSGLMFKQALTHARKAARSSIDTDWSDAVAEHQQAAADYSRTARTTNDSEVSHRNAMLEDCQG
jgi:hypothetical protein